MLHHIVRIGACVALLSLGLPAQEGEEDATRLEATEVQAEARSLSQELEDAGTPPPTLREIVDEARRKQQDGGILLTKNRFADSASAFRQSAEMYRTILNDLPLHREWQRLEKRVDRARMLAVGAGGPELEQATNALGKARDLFQAGHRDDSLQALEASARLYEALGPDHEAASVDRTMAAKKRMDIAKEKVVRLDSYDVSNDHRVQKNGSLLFFLHRAQISDQSASDALIERQQSEAEALYTAAANQYMRAAALQEKQRLIRAAIESTEKAHQKAVETLQEGKNSNSLQRGTQALDNAREIANDAATKEELEMAERMIDEAKQDFAKTIATAQMAFLQDARKSYRAALARTDEALLKQHANYEYDGALALARHGEEMAADAEFEDAIAAVSRAGEALDRATELAVANRKKHEADVALVSSRLERALADGNRNGAELSLAELENLLGSNHRQVGTYRMSVASLVQPNPEDAFDISTLAGAREAWEAVLGRVDHEGLTMRAAMALADSKTAAANAKSKALVGEEEVAARMYNQARESLSRAVVESRMRGAEPVIAQLEHALEAKDPMAAQSFLNKVAALIPNDPRLVDCRVRVALLASAIGEEAVMAPEPQTPRARVESFEAPPASGLVAAVSGDREASLSTQDLADSERMIAAAADLLAETEAAGAVVAEPANISGALASAVTDSEGNILLTADDLVMHGATLLDAVNARTDATILRRRANDLEPKVREVMARHLSNAEMRMRDGTKQLTRELYPEAVQAYHDASAYYRGVLDSGDVLDRLSQAQDEVERGSMIGSIFTDVSTLSQAQRHEHNAQGYIAAGELETAIEELGRARDIYQAYVPFESKASLEEAVAARTSMLQVRAQFPQLPDSELPKHHHERSIRQSLWELAVLRNSTSVKLTRDARKGRLLNHAQQTERTANRALWEHRYALAKSLYISTAELYHKAHNLAERGAPLRAHSADVSASPAPAHVFHGARLYRVPTPLAPDASPRAELAGATDMLKPTQFLKRVGEPESLPRARAITLRASHAPSRRATPPAPAVTARPISTPAVLSPSSATPAPRRIPAMENEIVPTEADIAVEETVEVPELSSQDQPLVTDLVRARENLAKSRIYFQADWLSNLDREDELAKLRQASIEMMAEAEDSFSELQNYPEAFDRGLRALELAQNAADNDLYHTAKRELVRATELFEYARNEAERLAAMRSAQHLTAPGSKVLPIAHRVQAVLEHYLTRQQRTIIAPLILKLEHAFAIQDGLRAEAIVDELEALLPDGPVLAELRALSADLPRPKKYLTLDLGNDVEMEFVLIRPGAFVMEFDTEDGIKKRKIRVDAPYYIGRFEVTQAQWEAVMGYNPSAYVDPQNPVENVSWEEIQVFMGRLREMYWYLRIALPTEQQWEYACRAGSTDRFSFGKDTNMLEDFAWYRGNSNGIPQQIGKKKPNAWGLYDMHGNVREWCANWYTPPARESVAVAETTSLDYVATRGGSFRNPAMYTAAGNRYRLAPDQANSHVGFRVSLIRESGVAATR